MPTYDLYNEKELLARLAAGDETALSHIYHYHWQPLFMAAYNITRDKAASEDILQEIFLQLWIKRESLEITSSLSAYLHTATRYQVFRYIKKSSATQHFFENLEERLASPSADRELHFKELKNQINQVVETLPEQCRLIYKMSREEHLSHKEIAERLNISTKTVENQLTIALRRIRSALGDLAIGVVIAALISF